MIYSLRHLTVYSFDVPVASATLGLRLRPRPDNYQFVRDYALEISPRPRFMEQHVDFFGNAAVFARIDEPHDELRIQSNAVVEIQQQAGLLAPDINWQQTAESALAVRDLSALSPAHFLFASPKVQLLPSLTDYALRSFKPERGVIESCTDLMKRIRADFAYEPDTTSVSTPVAEAFAMRRGVCQDFAHIMIAGLRGLGVPAYYVSGYLRTIPPPGKKRLQGADATHAWVAVWAGEYNGWVGFDPTNAVRTADDHIVLAVGRDFSDVSPVHGTFIGSGANRLNVEVDVISLTS